MERLQKLRSGLKESVRAVVQAQVTQPTTRADLLAQAQQIEENKTPKRSRGAYDKTSPVGPQHSNRKTHEQRYDPTKRFEKDTNGKTNNRDNADKPSRKHPPRSINDERRNAYASIVVKGTTYQRTVSQRKDEENNSSEAADKPQSNLMGPAEGSALPEALATEILCPATTSAGVATAATA